MDLIHIRMNLSSSPPLKILDPLADLKDDIVFVIVPQLPRCIVNLVISAVYNDDSKRGLGWVFIHQIFACPPFDLQFFFLISRLSWFG